MGAPRKPQSVPQSLTRDRNPLGCWPRGLVVHRTLLQGAGNVSWHWPPASGDGTHMRFVDLFAGLGGFRLALESLGHRCVFSSEADTGLQGIYEKNFGEKPEGDITGIRPEDVPSHDILTAGFPCQPFSKAGEQGGLRDRDRGGLYNSVLKILNCHQPRYFILENVPNLLRHKGGQTWRWMRYRLRKCGYDVDSHLLSPHHFGIPQNRTRAFVVGCRSGLDAFGWPVRAETLDTTIHDVLDERPVDGRPLTSDAIRRLTAWQKFLKLFPKDEQLPSFPIWTMEFGATYPYENATPHAMGERKLGRRRGTHGTPLKNAPIGQRMALLPSYARSRRREFPAWKIDFIRKNREFYNTHKEWIDPWLPSILDFPASFQKLEWNCKGEKRRIWDYIIQFRPSGIRVKRAKTAPSLVAMTISQVPVVAWERRYLTPREASRLQSMGELVHLPAQPSMAYKALGNAVNVEVVRRVALSLCGKGSATAARRRSKSGKGRRHAAGAA